MENEIRILEIDLENFIKQLEEMGAKKVGDWVQKRCTFDFKPAQRNKWFRLRTNGEETTLTIKEVEDKSKIDGTRELEINVSDFDKTLEILKELGYTPKALQENKRIRYMYEGIEIDIDSWPMIPTYVEIEGKSVDDVKQFLEKITFSKDKLTTLDVQSIYEEIYHIYISEYKVFTFERQEK